MQRPTIFSKINLSLLLLIYCVATLTLFQFIPVYFVDQAPRLTFYLFVYFALMFSSVFEILKYFGRTTHYLITKILAFVFLFFGFMVALLFVIGQFTVTWTEAAIYYKSKANPKVKILSRYLDAGALGGGTEPEDYKIVLHRPLTRYFKIETTVDTNKIDKDDWIKE
jgi:predicted membrane protein